jgi:hypothetical protein
VAKQDALNLFGRSVLGQQHLSWVALTAATGCLATGGWFLWQHSLGERVACRAPSAVIFLMLAGVLARIAWQLHLGRGCGLRFYQTHRGLVLRWLAAGPVVCYLGAIAVGPTGGFYFFATSLAVWNTAAVCPLVWSPGVVERFQQLLRHRWCRAVQGVMFGGVLALVTCEAGLRAIDLLVDGRPPTEVAVQGVRLAPGTMYSGRAVNTQGYWDDEFHPERSTDRFRVAVLGGPTTLSGSADTNCLWRMQRSLSGIEVLHFGIAQGGPPEYAAEVLRDALRMKPDLVLAFVSVGDDLRPTPGTIDHFHWQALRLYHWSRSPFETPGAESVLVSQSTDYESHLRRMGDSLAACRTPIPAPIEQRWSVVLASLDRIHRICQRRGIRCGLVIVPGEFQVSPVLWQTLARRRGYQPQQLDAELPQRQLKGFARSRQMPVLDLLPHLRASDATPYGVQTGELNDVGHAIASRAISGWLESQYKVGSTELAAAPAR